jgi:dipeptidyl aminopeptidase/acylaminoacyl peptidase
LYRPAEDRWERVAQLRKDIDPAAMGTLDLHRIVARDGLPLPVWVTLPQPKPTAPAPAVVLVHGGPWMRGVSWSWRAESQFLASRGWVVIEPEFRGSTGFGRRHFEAGWKQWGRAMQDDVADAVEWAITKGLVDRKRVCIAGGSYGGYAALMGLIRDPQLYRCGVAWAAVTDPRLLFRWSFGADLSDEARQFGLPVLIGDPVADAAKLAEVAPVEHAAKITAPLLLVFGGNDRRVPLEHGSRMREALRAAGRDPQYVVYAEEGHGWLRLENQLDFYRRVERFLAEQLQ